MSVFVTQEESAAIQTPPKKTKPPKQKFTLFPKLEPKLRHRIWRHAILGPRVVDVVYDEAQAAYFSFHAEIPLLLHVCKESRATGLGVYDICFGSSSRPACIPFDYQRDCLLFDDYLAFSFFAPRSAGSIDDVFGEREMNRVTGPMGQLELASIRKIAISAIFLSNSLESLVIVNEERDPYACGAVRFRELDTEEWCCIKCLLYCNMNLPASLTAMKMALSNGAGVKFEFRVRGVCRGEYKRHVSGSRIGRKRIQNITGGDDELELLQRSIIEEPEQRPKEEDLEEERAEL
ncbi:hypothetical protein LZ554_009313 [Drepanopeziza brunnea f. sp. 'monogermtubi']|nr:hypothetical protein LZ554_009313 [Drepanopeziza brunnea f. sp. 'monogermtubi']